MRPAEGEKENGVKDYGGRPILMTDENLKQTLRKADAECLVRKHEKTTGRTLSDVLRERLEGIAFRLLTQGKTERQVFDELGRTRR